MRSKGRHFLAWKTPLVSWVHRDRQEQDRMASCWPRRNPGSLQSARDTWEAWEGRAHTHREEWRRLQCGWGQSIPLPNAHGLHVEGQLAPTPAPAPAGHGGGGQGIQRSSEKNLIKRKTKRKGTVEWIGRQGGIRHSIFFPGTRKASLTQYILIEKA